MNPMTPPFAVMADDQTLIFQANVSVPTVENGVHDTAEVIYLSNSMDPTIRRLAQEVMAYRWANCQANP